MFLILILWINNSEHRKIRLAINSSMNVDVSEHKIVTFINAISIIDGFMMEHIWFYHILHLSMSSKQMETFARALNE